MRIPVRPDDLQTAGEPRAEVHDLNVPVLLEAWRRPRGNGADRPGRRRHWRHSRLAAAGAFDKRRPVRLQPASGGAVMGEGTQPDIVSGIRAKIAAGRLPLPADGPRKMWVGKGHRLS